MRKLIVILPVLLFTGCAPTVYERTVEICNGKNVAANERALARDHYLRPGGHYRCIR